MEIESFLSTKMVFVIFFYIATNIIPANTEEFSLATHSLKKQSQKLTLKVTKQPETWWKAVPKESPESPLHFRFGKDQNFYAYEGNKANTETIPFGKAVKIKQNRKKWKKATEVLIKSLNTKESITLKIEKTGKKQRVIKVIDIKNSQFKEKEMLNMHLSWN